MLPKLRLQPHLTSNVPLAPLTTVSYSPIGNVVPKTALTPPGKYLCRRDTGNTSPYPRSWSRQGRNCGFSRQHQPSTGDTSIDSLQRRSRSISNTLRRYQERRKESEDANRSRDRKKGLALILKRRYGIKFSLLDLTTMSEDAMTRRAVEKRGWKLAQTAAKEMLSWLTHTKISRKLVQAEAREHMAAFVIQMHWRKYKVRST